MKDGTVGWNPGKKNPNVLKAAGTIDPDVPLVFFESMDRKPLAAYVNYAVHLDNVGEPLISADMPATLSRCLAEYGGPDLVTVFTAGCCGDVNHIDVDWAEPQRGFANAARMGTILAAEVLRSWPRLRPVAPTALRVKSEIVSLALPELADGDEEKARAVITRVVDQKPPRPNFMEMVQAFKVRDVTARHGPAAGGGGPGDRSGKRRGVGLAAGGDLHRAGAGHQAGLAVSAHDRRRAGQWVDRLHPVPRAYAQGNYEVVMPAAPGLGRAPGRCRSEVAYSASRRENGRKPKMTWRAVAR